MTARSSVLDEEEVSFSREVNEPAVNSPNISGLQIIETFVHIVAELTPLSLPVPSGSLVLGTSVSIVSMV